MLSFSKK